MYMSQEILHILLHLILLVFKEEKLDLTKRYVFENGVPKMIPFNVNSGSIPYDDVVDKSQFRPNSESMRSVSSLVGSSGDGIYDDPDNPPDEIELAIRSGKLDKAEIDMLLTEKAQNIIDSDTKAQREKALEEKEAIISARQEYLDNATGFKGTNQDKTV